MRTVVQMAWGFSRAPTVLSHTIRYMTRPGMAPWPIADWSHQFSLFWFDDGSGEIHEALITERGWCRKPVSKLLNWVEKDPKRHVYELVELPIPQPVVWSIYHESCKWLGTKSYAILQLAVFAAGATRLGRRLAVKWPELFAVDVGDDQVVCSEGCCQTVGEKWPALDLRLPGEKWTALSPQLARNRLRIKINGVMPCTKTNG